MWADWIRPQFEEKIRSTIKDYYQELQRTRLVNNNQQHEEADTNSGSGGGSRPADGVQRDTNGDDKQLVRATRGHYRINPIEDDWELWCKQETMRLHWSSARKNASEMQNTKV